MNAEKELLVRCQKESYLFSSALRHLRALNAHVYSDSTSINKFNAASNNCISIKYQYIHTANAVKRLQQSDYNRASKERILQCLLHSYSQLIFMPSIVHVSQVLTAMLANMNSTSQRVVPEKWWCAGWPQLLPQPPSESNWHDLIVVLDSGEIRNSQRSFARRTKSLPNPSISTPILMRCYLHYPSTLGAEVSKAVWCENVRSIILVEHPRSDIWHHLAGYSRFFNPNSSHMIALVKLWYGKCSLVTGREEQARRFCKALSYTPTSLMHLRLNHRKHGIRKKSPGFIHPSLRPANALRQTQCWH